MKLLLKFHKLSMCFDEPLKNWGGSIINVGVRTFIGWQFFKSGLVKIQDWEGTLSLFQEEYIVPVLSPEIAACLATFGELALPILLVIGLFSRPAALGLFIVNAVAVFSYPQLFEFECPAAINEHFYWGILLLMLAVYGGGKLSLDYLISRKYVT
jgi:putative oxidoreductase